MKRLAAFALLLAAVPAVAAEAPSPKDLVARVSADDKSISWDAFRLGMTLDDLQTVLEKTLSLTPGSEGVATTDRYATDVSYRGVNVHVAFESDDPSAALVFIRVDFPKGAAVDAAALTEALKARVPALEKPDDPTSKALMLPGTDYHVAVKTDGIYLGTVWLFE